MSKSNKAKKWVKNKRCLWWHLEGIITGVLIVRMYDWYCKLMV